MKKYLIPPRIFLPALIVWLFLSSVSTVFDNLNDPIEKPVIMLEEKVKLPSPDMKGEISLEETLLERRSIRSYQDDPLELNQVSQLLWAAQGITLETRGFRTAPSAGATYPLEIYLAAGKVNNLQSGLYRYVPADHSLVMVIDTDIRQDIAKAALGQNHVRSAPALIVISADYDRTARRYGDRAQRYVHMEAGHAGQNISLQAVASGLGTVMVGAFEDNQLKSVLDLPPNEDPLYIIPVGKPD